MFITEPSLLKKFHSENRVWQGIPGIERTKGGRLFSTFYSGGIKEQLGNYCLLLQSDDDGITWSEPVAAVYKDESNRCYDPCLWLDPLKRLWFIWAVMPEYGVWAVLCENPDSPCLKWSEPFRIGQDVMMNKPTVLSTGEWLFPIAVWASSVMVIRGVSSQDEQRLAFAYKTNDNGKSFTQLGGVDMPERSFDEHMILELKDGSLMMLVRTKYGIGKSYSYDGGHTWTPGVDSGIKGPCSRFYISRLSSGRILLVNHHRFTGRSHLTAFLSDDECQTWKGGLLLDERSQISYPDATEGDNGFIYITYDHERGCFLKDLQSALSCDRAIVMAKITEEDILAGSLVTEGSRLKGIISRLGQYKGEDPNPYGELSYYTHESYIEMLSEMATSEDVLNRIFNDYGRFCVSCTQENRMALDTSIDEFIHLKDNSDPHKRLYLIGKMVGILKSINGQDDVDSSFFTVERIFDYINTHLTVEFSLDTLSDDLQISKFYMCHVFKEKTGTTISQYRSRRRMHLAKKWLATSDIPITDIGLRAGFGDPSYFAKCFKSEEGLSPSRYRELHRYSKV